MTRLKSYIDDTLYPALFERVDEAFPSLSFVRKGGDWYSPKKMDGTEPRNNRYDKTIVKARFPRTALEQGGGVKTLITLYMEQNGLDFIPAVKGLSQLCGLELPPMENPERYKAYMAKQEGLENLAQEMEKALRDRTTKEAGEVYRYLEHRQGGDPAEFIKYGNLGYCSQEMAGKLRQFLPKVPGAVGKSHTLAIPYKSGGSVIGFVFRQIGEDGGAKYLDAFISDEATKRSHFFGLTGLKRSSDEPGGITIVEGELDALQAGYKGINGVVAASSSSLSSEALGELKRRGFNSVTLLFDKEEDAKGREEMAEKIDKALTLIYKAGLSAYVATFPGDDGTKVDADSYLRGHSGDDLGTIIKDADEGTSWIVYNLALPYLDDPTNVSEPATAKEHKELERKTIAKMNSLNLSRTDRERMAGFISEALGREITQEAIQEVADEELELQAKGEQDSRMRHLLAEANTKLKKDEFGQVASFIRCGLDEIQAISNEAKFANLLRTPSLEDIFGNLKRSPDGIRTGFFFGEGEDREELTLKGGGLTYVCAPTSHGKSRMLENLALRVATNEEPGEVLYFSFEEEWNAVVKQFVNIHANIKLSRNNLRTLNDYYKTGHDTYFSGSISTGFVNGQAELFRLLTNGRLRVYSEGYDSGELTEAIRSIYKNLRKEGKKVKAVFIDYIQLLHTKGTRAGRKEELADMCRRFMELAKETGLPLIFAAQLNREALSPLEMDLQNIAEASEIEHSANLVIYLWNSSVMPLERSRYYENRAKGVLSKEAKDLEARGFVCGVPGKFYAKLVKNREGRRNIDAILDFNGNTGRISQDVGRLSGYSLNEAPTKTRSVDPDTY